MTNTKFCPDTENDNEMDAVMTLAEFIGSVQCGGLTNDDGIGFYGTATHHDVNASVSPSETREPDWAAPAGATHVTWFNK